MILTNLDYLNNNFFEVIIIGTGPAGISTALKLEKYKIKTLIIEAGNLELSEDKENFFKGKVYGDIDPSKDLSSIRSRGFGGTSALWGGHCSKFEKYQFTKWPIDYEDCYKFENECNKILGLKSYHTGFYYKKFNEDFNQLHRRFASNLRFKDTYFDKIKNSKYIYLSLNTSFLHFNGSSNQIKSINCRVKDNLIDLKSKYYVLAAGGIENSRLLLWSRVKNEKLFHKDLPIGNYYMDHPWHSPGEGVASYNELIKYFKRNEVSREFYIDCLPRLYLSPNTKFKKDNDLLSIALWLRFKNKDNLKKSESFLTKALCVAPNFFKTYFEENKEDDLFKFKVSLHHEQEPLFENKIYLDKKLDPFGIPLINLNWKMSNKLKRTAKESLIALGKFLIDKNIGRISIDEYIFEENFKSIFSGTHQMGGTSMGTDYNNSVVDKDLKVHLIKNLFITGSSVFPTSGHGHPTYTIICLSLRLGEHLKKILEEREIK
jgi:choline dehydrogenase-like flavoprotein